MPDSIARVWDIVEKVGVGMLTTRFDGGLRARPLEPRLDRVAGVIRFVTDIRGAKDDEVEAAPDACFIVIEPKGKAYLSISGHAIIIRDRDIAGRNLEKDRRRLVVGWPRRSERARTGIPARDGGALGRSVKLGRRGD